MDSKILGVRLPSEIIWPIALDFFLLSILKDQVYRTFGPNLTNRKRWLTIAIRNVLHEIPDTVWIIIETHKHVVIGESVGQIERQWNSIKIA